MADLHPKLQKRLHKMLGHVVKLLDDDDHGAPETPANASAGSRSARQPEADAQARPSNPDTDDSQDPEGGADDDFDFDFDDDDEDGDPQTRGQGAGEAQQPQPGSARTGDAGEAAPCPHCGGKMHHFKVARCAGCGSEARVPAAGKKMAKSAGGAPAEVPNLQDLITHAVSAATAPLQAKLDALEGMALGRRGRGNTGGGETLSKAALAKSGGSQAQSVTEETPVSEREFARLFLGLAGPQPGDDD